MITLVPCSPWVVVMIICSACAPLWAHYGARFEPPDGTVFHGCGWNGYNSQANYAAMFPADHHSLILQVVSDVPGTRGIDVARVIQEMTNPIVHPDSQFIEYGLHFRDREGMLDSVFALTTEMDHYIDTLALAFLAVNRPFFLRIGFEFNGDWNPYHPYIFPLAYRKLVSELRDRGVDNFASVWCYEPDAAADFADSNNQGWKWYPGDDVVDWFGLDPFDMEHFNPNLPDSSRGELSQKGKTEAFLRFAHVRGKPVYLNELSARNVDIVHDSLDTDHSGGLTDWEYWFVPFFEFVNLHPGIKGWNYINLDWTRYETYESWGDARLEINSFIREHWVDSLLDTRFLNIGYDITQEVSVQQNRLPLVEFVSLSVYPNPFNSLLNIAYEIPASRFVAITVVDVLGRELATTFERNKPAGIHLVSWQSDNLGSGNYFVRLQVPGASACRKVVVLK